MRARPQWPSAMPTVAQCHARRITHMHARERARVCSGRQPQQRSDALAAAAVGMSAAEARHGRDEIARTRS